MANGRRAPKRKNGQVRVSEMLALDRDRLRPWGGAMLVLVGVLFLLNNFGISTGFLWRLWPAVPIGLGFAILLRK